MILFSWDSNCIILHITDSYSVGDCDKENLTRGHFLSPHSCFQDPVLTQDAIVRNLNDLTAHEMNLDICLGPQSSHRNSPSESVGFSLKIVGLDILVYWLLSPTPDGGCIFVGVVAIVMTLQTELLLFRRRSGEVLFCGFCIGAKLLKLVVHASRICNITLKKRAPAVSADLNELDHYNQH